MRKQFVNTVERILNDIPESVLILGDIGVFGFRNSFKKYPNRVYNIGILEQSTIGMASGLSKVGMIPIVHTIAPFLVERAYEQLKIDFGYQKINGNFVSVGSSYDYAALGPTHHCPSDVPILKNIPNMQIIVPGSSYEFNLLFNQTYNNGYPTYFRLSESENKFHINDISQNKANIIKNGKNATLICIGTMLDSVIEATKNIDMTILYYTTISPFDYETLYNNFNENIIICEPYYMGAINYEVNKTFTDKKHKILNIGIPHEFLTNYGTKEEHDIQLGLTHNDIYEKIKKFIC
jgi:transketolase